MLNSLRLHGVYCCKFLKSVIFEASGWQRQLRQMHLNMNNDPFLPPLSVKGMKVLDKEQFKKIVAVPCFYLPFKSIEDGQKSLKPYLLKLPNFRPLDVVSPDFMKALENNGIDTSSEGAKMAMLDPRKIKSFSDLDEIQRHSLQNLGFNEKYMASVDLTITYENYKPDVILRSVIPSEFDGVSGYSLVGHIIHLNLRDHLLDYKQIIGSILLDKIKPARSVVNKVDIIDNTFRSFQMELLCGDKDMIARVQENKCVFEFDFSQVYWNPRLSTEHERIVSGLKKNDVLYDVFCGVGPFAIPAAKKGCIVLANDLNPYSIEWLKKNLKLNKIIDNLTVYNKDGNEFIRTDLKQHMMTLIPDKCNSINIVMNLPALAPTFLPSFQSLFSEEELSKINALPTPKVMVYCFVKGVCDDKESAIKLVSTELGMDLTLKDEEIDDVFFVRDVAPKKKMMRVTLLLTDRILLNKKRQIPIDETPPKKACH